MYITKQHGTFKLRTNIYNRKLDVHVFVSLSISSTSNEEITPRAKKEASAIAEC
jgi:hypothetical protein